MSDSRFGVVVYRCGWCNDQLSRVHHKMTLCTTCYRHAGPADRERYEEGLTKDMKDQLNVWDKIEEVT